MKKIVLGLSVAALAFSLSACKDLKMAQNAIKQENNGESSGEGESGSGNNPLDALKKNLGGETSDVDELEEYNNYVDFSNFLVNDFVDHLHTYFTAVADDPTFQATEQGIYPRYGFSKYDEEDVQKCLDQANKGTHFANLDENVKVLAPIVLDAMKVYNEAANYGELEGYKDDQYAKAAEIHSRFYPLIESYVNPANAYTANVHSIALERQEKEMQQVKDAGYIIRYDMLKIMRLKNDILDAISEQSATVSEANITELDLTKIRPAYDELAALLLEFNPLVDDEEAAEKEGFSHAAAAVHLSAFARSAGDFKKQVQKLIERVESGEGFSEFELNTPSIADGNYEKISEDASDMTSNYNSAVG